VPRAKSRSWKTSARERKSSFLKKRSKKLLIPGARAGRNARARVQKFFGSFFQKRTAFLPVPGLAP
jgi:hypothetical protein